MSADGTPYPSIQESERNELERIRILVRTTKTLIQEVETRLDIDTDNWRRLLMSAHSARVLTEAALRTLQLL